jgi:hypothetical protein
MADTPAAPPEPTEQPPAAVPGTPKAALRRLQRHAFLLLAGLLASLIAAVAVVVVLIDAPSTSDLQKLGVIAAVAGLAGGSARGVVEVAGLVRQGFRAETELVIYDGFVRSMYEDEVRRYERDTERLAA